MIKSLQHSIVLTLALLAFGPARAGDFYLKVDPAAVPGTSDQSANFVIEDDQIEEQRSSHEEVAIETALSQFEDAEIDLQPVLNTDPKFQNKLNARRQLEADRQQLIADMEAKHDARIAIDRAHIRADIALLQQLQMGITPALPTVNPARASAEEAPPVNPAQSTTGSE